MKKDDAIKIINKAIASKTNLAAIFIVPDIGNVDVRMPVEDLVVARRVIVCGYTEDLVSRDRGCRIVNILEEEELAKIKIKKAIKEIINLIKGLCPKRLR